MCECVCVCVAIYASAPQGSFQPASVESCGLRSVWLLCLRCFLSVMCVIMNRWCTLSLSGFYMQQGQSYLFWVISIHSISNLKCSSNAFNLDSAAILILIWIGHGDALHRLVSITLKDLMLPSFKAVEALSSFIIIIYIYIIYLDIF